MFGYIRPRRDALLVREDAHYRAAYCGLCRCLGQRYGLAARFLVNYDMTFLYLLLSGLRAAEPCGRCFCPANPLRRKKCVPMGPELEYCADVCVILGVSALDDARRDGRGLRKLPAAAARAVLSRAFRSACRRQPELAARTRHQLDRLHALEQARCARMDEAADAFATILSHLADPFVPDEPRPMQQLLYHVGRFIYLTDALDDLQRDVRRGDYNPLIYRYSCPDGRLRPDDRAALLQTVRDSAALAQAALNLCELKSQAGILENILSPGLNTVLCAVDRGEFRKKARGEP